MLPAKGRGPCRASSAGRKEMVPEIVMLRGLSVCAGEEEAAAVGAEFFTLIEEFLRAVFLHRMLLYMDADMGATAENKPAFKSRRLVVSGICL